MSDSIQLAVSEKRSCGTYFTVKEIVLEDVLEF